MPTLNTFPASPLPDLPLTITPKYKTNETRFGDGYRLVAEDGLNTTEYQIRIKWTNINEAEKDLVSGFLVAHSPTTPFYYDDPDIGQRPYVCDKWSKTQVDAAHWTVQATFEEYHGV